MAETPLQRNDSRRALCDRLRAILNEATSERHLRDDWVKTPDGNELGWMVYERDRMHAAVNSERAALGKPPVPLTAILGAERRAAGHSDYVAQFSWGCAGLVMDRDDA